MKLSVKIWKSGKWYVAEIPELGVVTQGRTKNSAKRNLKEATMLYIETMIDYKMKPRGIRIENGQLVRARRA